LLRRVEGAKSSSECEAVSPYDILGESFGREIKQLGQDFCSDCFLIDIVWYVDFR
jgi:hypothetical protein